MQRYFVKTPIEDTLTLTDLNQVHHIQHVMRLNIGDKTVVCDQLGQCYYMRIESITQTGVVFSRLQALPKLDNVFHVTLAQALIRQDHFELVCQKAIELGVDMVLPIETTRSILPSKETTIKGAENQSIALCAREHNLTLDTLDYTPYDVILVAYENEHTKDLRTALHSLNKDIKLLLIVGPEGGFTENEIRFLESKKAQTVSLGKKIMRSETATLYLLSVLAYEQEVKKP